MCVGSEYKTHVLVLDLGKDRGLLFTTFVKMSTQTSIVIQRMRA